ncbi:MAG: VOC family protein [Geitlerinemataceae cyanobacterium]
MKYGYTIVYVDSVEATLDFYCKAFGFTVRMLHEEDGFAYGELETGATVLAFASHTLGEMNLDGNYHQASLEDKPFGFELAFVTEDVQAAHDRAVECGAVSLKLPMEKPWGQTVSYVRAIDGSIIEFCTPMSQG